MESNHSNFFVPKCLEKELKIIEDSEFTYFNIYKAFFNFTNDKNKTIESYKKLISNEPKNRLSLDSDEDLFSIIIPNCSKDFVFKVFKDFEIHHNTQINTEECDDRYKGKTDEVVCCHQRKLKEKATFNNSRHNEGQIIQNKHSLIGNLYSKTLSKIFGSNQAHIEGSNNRVNSVFNKITKINNIDFNCDYFHVELESYTNLSALGKLKSNFVSQYKTYDLFRLFYETNPNPVVRLNKKKNLDLNSNSNCSRNIINNLNLINDSESLNPQSQIISQNNDETTDDCNNMNSRLIQGNNFYQSKKTLNNNNNFNSDEAKNPGFSVIFFKFICSENKRNYFNFKMPFAKQTNANPEEEFVLVVSLVETSKPSVNGNFKVKSNSRDLEEKLINNNKSNAIIFEEHNEAPKNFNVYTKVNFSILTKSQIEKIEVYSSNKQIANKFLEEFSKENSKVNLFRSLIEKFKALILSKTKFDFENKNRSKEEEELLLQAFISFEQVVKNGNNSTVGFNNLQMNPASDYQDEMKVDLIDMNFCRSDQGFNSNRSTGSGVSLIDLEQLNSKWIIDFNEEINNDFKFQEDLEYPSLKKMQALDLKKYGYYEIYLQMLTQLKDILKADPFEVFGENELIRHIYGWRGDLDGCRESLLVMLDWRKTTKPESFTFEGDFAIYPEIPFKSLLYIACEDIYGRPVLKFCPSLLNPKALNVDLLCKYLIFVLESTCKQMTSYLDKFILFVDLKDVGYSNVSTEHLKKVNEFTRKYYVERLAKIYLINKGFFFSVVWSIVSKFMDERIHKKLVVVDKSHKASLEYLLGDSYNKIGINL